MKHLTGKISGAFAAVQFVAKNRMTEMMEVDPNLVGATGVDRAFNQACVAARADDAIFSLRRAACAFCDAHFFAMNGMTRDRRVDGAG